jgi:LacI family transcriptional regulator
VLAGRHVPGAADVQLDPAALTALMTGAHPPTGIFGLRDWEAWQAQDILLNDTQHRFDNVPIIGYGNTPWSQAARPPLSTIDWNLDAIAAEACRLIEAAVTNTLGEPECHVIAPRLIVR